GCALRGARCEPEPLAAAVDSRGSNNWAVAPHRTAAGHALLAGDPHLELTLPAIWYEAHIVVPGKLDVYGVTIPGQPFIIIGFNRDIAWTFTNTEADVIDYYAETVDDATQPTRYLLDGRWRALETRVETYRGRRGDAIATDTLRFTHRGPLFRVGEPWHRPRGPGAAAPRWVSMRWTMLDPVDAASPFAAMARARSVAEFQRGTAAYPGPAQNMLVADRAGSIAIRSTGFFPIRPGDGRGDVLRDGSRSESDWRGYWSVSDYPQAVNPAQGFLASANQQPVDPAVHPRYLGTHWYPPWRAMRINRLLRSDSAVTPDAMRLWQTDPGSPRADIFRRAFLEAAQSRAGDETLARAAALLGEWDGRYVRDDRRAVLFEMAMNELRRRLWGELRLPDDAAGQMPEPSDAVVAALLRDTASAWWDDRATRTVERRDDILSASLRTSLETAVHMHGESESDGWRWDRVNNANIYHLLHVPSFSALKIPVQGGPSTLNPTAGSGTFGASWRMVVELAPEIRAWGVYPGGQSGNPVSRRYSDRLPKWAAGELDSLRVPRSPSDLPAAQVLATLVLSPRRR
ncbi:MAG: penicillin acylase family protein, partial [Gemmatimonadota bacterium]|nr:penicillin acylase family protein [Gemmatimonadota bacterium]